MPDCKYCGKWFRSNKGLNLHITKMHTSESIFGNKIIDPFKVDPIGAMEEREKRRKKRMKKSDKGMNTLFNF